MIKTSFKRSLDVVRRVCLEARGDAAPLARHERQRDLAHAEVIVDGVEAPLRLERKREIPVPVALGHDGAASRPNGQRERSPLRDQQALAFDRDVGRKATYDRRTVVIAVVGQQRDPQ